VIQHSLSDKTNRAYNAENSLNSLLDNEITLAKYDEVRNTNSLLADASQIIYREPATYTSIAYETSRAKVGQDKHSDAPRVSRAKPAIGGASSLSMPSL